MLSSPFLPPVRGVAAQLVQWLDYGLQDRDSVLGSGRDFNLFATAVPRPALGPTQPPDQLVAGALSSAVKQPGREAYHTPPSGAEVKNAWKYTSTSPNVIMSWCFVKNRANISFTSPLPVALWWRPGSICETDCIGCVGLGLPLWFKRVYLRQQSDSNAFLFGLTVSSPRAGIPIVTNITTNATQHFGSLMESSGGLESRQDDPLSRCNSRHYKG
jgi:hypothetical protein